jgi:hypothetical protein
LHASLSGLKQQQLNPLLKFRVAQCVGLALVIVVREFILWLVWMHPFRRAAPGQRNQADDRSYDASRGHEALLVWLGRMAENAERR